MLRFATLLLVALSMGMAFAHALELRPKMHYEPATYLLLAEMSLNAPPQNWTQFRNQWEYTHLARFFLQLASLGALLMSVLVETPDTVDNSTLGGKESADVNPRQRTGTITR